MAHKPMQLETNDPKEALQVIANYLRTVSLKDSRRVVERFSFDHVETLGFWQSTEWLEGLLEIADECDRIIQSANSATIT